MNKNGKTISIILGLLLALAMPLAARAQAGDRGVYVGVGGGQAEPIQYDACDTFPTCKKKGTAWKFFGGWQFGRHWALEYGFTDFGKASASSPTTSQSIKSRASEVTILGQWVSGNDRFALFGKAGAYYANTTADTTVSGVSTRVTEGRGNATFGAGLQYYIWRGLAIRGEGQHYMKVGGATIGDSDYNVYTISLLYKL